MEYGSGGKSGIIHPKTGRPPKFQLGDVVKHHLGSVYTVTKIRMPQNQIQLQGFEGVWCTSDPYELVKSKDKETHSVAQFKATESDGSSTDYYLIPEDAIDLLDLIEHKKMDFGIGNIFKACYRMGEKSGIDQAYDLRKIIFFAERKLKEIEKT